ncbi:uncharacterized protein MELLADRAFT_67300 [Melampsora larici-populina 98AG31]|uniref:Uncharacterized protein n=1 Tax=Melampsora larici-populina (strain 98AG31 / pathotype 3-4-7) TaxID=747676 RepID=F4S2W8_MELLP|nr:uncharacterized protein MELLADRAFT_67300 [Melampsora larici-populina 98AG31]EGG01016.1 hypothetical protein MELLADRAFT_67300 [Melampsora larici-populina 98AG31]
MMQAMAHWILKIMRHGQFWQILMHSQLFPLSSALQNKLTATSIIQNFAEGNIWFDNNIHEEENLCPFSTPNSPELSQFHDSIQDEGNKYLTHGILWQAPSNQKEGPHLASPLIPERETVITSKTSHSAFNPPEQHGAIVTGLQSSKDQIFEVNPMVASWDLEAGYLIAEESPTYLKSPTDSLCNLHDEYWNAHSYLGPPSQPDLSTSDILNSYGDFSSVPEDQNVPYKDLFSNMDQYNILNPPQENIYSQGKFESNHHQNIELPGEGVLSNLQNMQRFPHSFPSQSQGPIFGQSYRDLIQQPLHVVNNHISPNSVQNYIQGSENLPQDFCNIPFVVEKSLIPEASAKGKRKVSESIETQHFLHSQENLRPIATSFNARLFSSGEDSEAGACGHLKNNTPTKCRGPKLQRFSSSRRYYNCGVQEHPHKNPFVASIEPAVKEISRPFTHTQRQSKEALVMLQNIGAFYVNNSPSLCISTTIWFEELKSDMIKNNSSENSVVKAVEHAMRLAHLEITMCFFGLMQIFAAKTVDQSSLGIMMQEGWRFIKDEFETWRDLDLTRNGLESIQNLQITKDPHIPHKKLGVTASWEGFYVRGNGKRPLSSFEYLSSLTQFTNIQFKFFRVLIDKWNQHQTVLKLGRQALGHSYSEIQTFRNLHVKYIHGGFYSRAGIGNLVFSGVKLSRDNGVSSNEPQAVKTGHQICLRFSQCAQFHSPVGFDMCQDVHIFFVSLIEHLLSSYKSVYDCDTSAAGKHIRSRTKHLSSSDQHQGNVQNIVKAVSMAQYRLTVAFMGLVRALYSKDVQDHTLQILLASAWDFLKGIFSRWRDFKFDQDLHTLFKVRSSNEDRMATNWEDPHRLFNALWKHKDIARYPLQILGLKTLFQAWSYILLNSKINQTDQNFEIKFLHANSPFGWALS